MPSITLFAVTPDEKVTLASVKAVIDHAIATADPADDTVRVSGDLKAGDYHIISTLLKPGATDELTVEVRPVP